LLYVTRKKDAEAERMYEHSLAQQYIQGRMCDVEIVCSTCESVTKMSTLGHRVCEKAWGVFKLDVGVVIGDEVVGAIEILNTSVVSRKKVEAMATSGLAWAEVRASDIIVNVREIKDTVRAVRGGGVCKICNHTETQGMLSRQLAEFEETRTNALKRKAQAHKDVEDASSAIKQTRAKLLRMIV
jgi:hypothetical protein